MALHGDSQNEFNQWAAFARAQLNATCSSTGLLWAKDSAYQIPCSIEYGPTDGFQVTAHGIVSAAPWSSEQPPGLLLATDRISNKLTLLDPITNFPGYHSQVQSISAAVGVVGKHLERLDQRWITYAEVELEHLSDWIGEPPFQANHFSERMERDDLCHFSIDVELPSHILFQEEPGDLESVAIGAECGSQWDPQNYLTITRRSVLQFRFRNEVSTSELLAHVYNQGILFTLLTGAPAVAARISAGPPDSEESLRLAEILAQPIWQGYKRYYNRMLMPANFDRCREAGMAPLKRWSQVLIDFEPVLRLLASAIYGRGRFAEDRFILAAQALEGFCRIDDPAAFHFPKGEFGVIADRMLDGLPPHFPTESRNQWRERLGHLNEFSLRGRLGNLFDRYQTPKLVLGKGNTTLEEVKVEPMAVEKFCHDFSTCRNSLTHVEELRVRPMPDASTLHRLTVQAIRVLSFAFLEKLGVPPSQESIAACSMLWWQNLRG